jgi:membrane associated rhomboid family serine protease
VSAPESPRRWLNPPEPAPQPARRLDPTSWSGAMVMMVALGAVLWIVQFINAGDNYRLDRFGLRPRQVDGLEGIVFSPFLHASYGHLVANSAPFVIIGWVVLIGGIRQFAIASALIILLGGFATWLVAPSGLIVGVSALVMGWLGYLIARAYFSRKLKWIAAAVVVLLFFGTILGNLLPSVDTGISWQGHLCGFLAGVVAGALLHPRRPKNRRPRVASRPGSVS